jgi:Na+/proline symporter
MQMYLRLAIALVASLVVMFGLSFLQTRTWSHLLPNFSNFYISLTMIGAMGLIMLVVMWPMFENRKVNAGLAVGFVAVLASGVVLARTETFVGDEAFLRSMIPHHSRAVLVCQEATITDSEIVELCDQIVSSQLEEIARMQDLLRRPG